MIERILEKIYCEKNLTVSSISKDLGISYELTEYLLMGLEKKKYLISSKSKKTKIKNQMEKPGMCCRGNKNTWELTENAIRKIETKVILN